MTTPIDPMAAVKLLRETLEHIASVVARTHNDHYIRSTAISALAATASIEQLTSEAVIKLTKRQIHDIAKDASERVARNARTAPELCYAPIRSAIEDSLASIAEPEPINAESLAEVMRECSDNPVPVLTEQGMIDICTARDWSMRDAPAFRDIALVFCVEGALAERRVLKPEINDAFIRGAALRMAIYEQRSKAADTSPAKEAILQAMVDHDQALGLYEDAPINSVPSKTGIGAVPVDDLGLIVRVNDNGVERVIACNMICRSGNDVIMPAYKTGNTEMAAHYYPLAAEKMDAPVDEISEMATFFDWADKNVPPSVRKASELSLLTGWLARAALQQPGQADKYALYNELIFAVGSKFEGESRHQTALRYILEAEESATADAKSMPSQAKP